MKKAYRCACVISWMCLRTGCTLFPYTTLFRSYAVRTIQVNKLGKERFMREGAVLEDDWEPFAVFYGQAEPWLRSEEHTSELQSLTNLVCRLLLEKKDDLAKLKALGELECNRLL